MGKFIWLIMPVTAIIVIAIAWKLIDKYMATKVPSKKKISFDTIMNRIMNSGRVLKDMDIVNNCGETFHVAYIDEYEGFRITSDNYRPAILEKNFFGIWQFHEESQNTGRFAFRPQKITSDYLQQIICRWVMCEYYKNVMPAIKDFDISAVQKEFSFDIYEDVDN